MERERMTEPTKGARDGGANKNNDQPNFRARVGKLGTGTLQGEFLTCKIQTPGRERKKDIII